MRRIILPLTAVALCASAAYMVLPRAHESYLLLDAQDNPAVLADIAVEKALSEPVARTEIENALNAGDPELAASFLELARDRGIVVDPQLAERVDAANAAGAQAVRAAASFGHGLVTGAPDDLAGSRVLRPAIYSCSGMFAMRRERVPIWRAANRPTSSFSGLPAQVFW